MARPWNGSYNARGFPVSDASPDHYIPTVQAPAHGLDDWYAKQAGFGKGNPVPQAMMDQASVSPKPAPAPQGYGVANGIDWGKVTPDFLHDAVMNQTKAGTMDAATAKGWHDRIDTFGASGTGATGAHDVYNQMRDSALSKNAQPGVVAPAFNPITGVSGQHVNIPQQFGGGVGFSVPAPTPTAPQPVVAGPHVFDENGPFVRPGNRLFGASTPTPKPQSVASYEEGTPLVPGQPGQPVPAILHAGEAVIPANQNPANAAPPAPRMFRNDTSAFDPARFIMGRQTDAAPEVVQERINGMTGQAKRALQQTWLSGEGERDAGQPRILPQINRETCGAHAGRIKSAPADRRGVQVKALR